jgi:hypothetical protein
MNVRLFAALALGMFCITAPALGQEDKRIKAYETILDNLLLAIGDMTDALKRIEDIDTVDKGHAQFRNAVTKFLEFRKEAEKLKLPDKKQREEIIEKYRDKLAGQMDALRAEVARVQRIPGGKKVLEELLRINPQPKKKSEPMK